MPILTIGTGIAVQAQPNRLPVSYSGIGTVFTTAGSNSWVIDLPDFPVAAPGDLLIMAIAHSNQASTPTPPSNWTEFTGSPRGMTGGGYLRMYWRACPSPVPSTATWGWSVSNGGAAACFAFKNARLTPDPFDGLAFNNGGADTSGVGTAVVPVTTNGILVNVCTSAGSRTFTPPGSTTEIVADQGGGPSMNIVYKQLTAGGSTGTLTHTISSNVNWATVMFVVRGE